MIFRTYQPNYREAVLALVDAAASHDKTRRLPPAAFDAGMQTPEAWEQSTLVFTREGALAGFIWWGSGGTGIVECEGWVHPDYRRKGYGTSLLTAAEAYTRRQLPGSTLQGRTYDDIPGAVPLFIRRGFTAVRRFYRMQIDLRGRHIERVEVPGITFRTFERGNLEPLVEADNDIFSSHWGSQPKTVAAWRQNMIETRHHDPALWVLAWEGDRIVAECLCHASRDGGPQDGWVSIVGVREAWRGRGLGRAVLLAGLIGLQAAGYHTASLHVDAENTAAVNLYRAAEMDVVRTRLHFAKQLPLR
jgi:mycothiol synthase